MESSSSEQGLMSPIQIVRPVSSVVTLAGRRIRTVSPAYVESVLLMVFLSANSRQTLAKTISDEFFSVYRKPTDKLTEAFRRQH